MPSSLVDEGGRRLLRTLWLLVLVSVLDKNGGVEACAQQYRRELRYLDYYLGIAPATEDGSFPVNC